MATTVGHYPPIVTHDCIMNITPHVCKGLEAIWAYTACAPLAWFNSVAGILNRFKKKMVLDKSQKSPAASIGGFPIRKLLSKN